MKKTSTLSLILSLCAAAALYVPPAARAQSPDSMQAFWQKFSAAVRAGDRATVASLSRFPIGMSYGVPSVKTAAQVNRRWRALFSEQADAVACFGKAKPETEAGSPKKFTVACPDAAGNEVVIYHFDWTRRGWRFTALDNINE